MARTDLIRRLRDIHLMLDTTTVEDGRWTDKARATLDEAIEALSILTTEEVGDQSSDTAGTRE